MKRDKLLKRVKVWVKESPAWAISIGLHLAIVLGATLVYIEHYLSTDEGEVVINMRALETEKIVDLEGAKEPPQETPEDDPSDRDPAPLEELKGADDSLGDGGDLLSGGDSGQGAQDLSDVMGVVSGTGTRPGGGTARRRRGGAKQARKPLPPEDGVGAALRWLARHQNADGSWSVTGFEKNCGRFGHRDTCVPNAFPGNEQFSVGVSSLALLAFLGAEHLPSSRDPVLPEGRDGGELSLGLEEAPRLTHGEVVLRALKHLTRSQSPSGMVGPEVDRSIYNHLIATVALCEASGLTGVPALRDRAEAALRYTLEARSPGQGWRYSIQSPDADSSVTGWAVMALKSAETAGLPFDRALYGEVRRWFDRATVEAAIDSKLLPGPARKRKHLLTGYLGPEDAGKLVSVPGLNDEHHYTPSSTAIMVLAASMMEGKLDAKAESALDTLLAFLPLSFSPSEKQSWRRADFYYWYHGTFALHEAVATGDDRWKLWSEALEAALRKTQNLEALKGRCVEGSWDPVDRWSCEGGRVYATAMAALTLEVHHRYPGIVGLVKAPRKLAIDVR